MTKRKLHKQPLPTLKERFDAKWKLDPITGCWMWTASMTKGQGALLIGGRGGRNVMAHRIAHALYIGPVPDSLCVMHRCENMSCVNPEHLFLGSLQDRSDHMTGRGRQHSTLKPHDVEIARLRHTRGVALPVIARDLGVSESGAASALTGSTWRHVGGHVLITKQPAAGARHPRCKLSSEDVCAIRKSVADGERTADIAFRYGISTNHVRRIARGARRPGAVTA